MNNLTCKKILFSFETPIKYLDEMNISQDYLFIIGHHLEIPKYYDYCKNYSGMKFLDNSAYELGESIPPKKLKEYIDRLKIDAVVLPDKLFDEKRSNELEAEFKALFTEEERKKIKFIKVVHADNLVDYEKNLVKIIYDKDVDIIGISQSRRLIAPNLSYLFNIIYEHMDIMLRTGKRIHLLGMQHPFEIREASWCGFIDTIDTGSPINFAFKGLEYPRVKKAEDFKRESGEDLESQKELDVELAKKNIEILKSYNTKT